MKKLALLLGLFIVLAIVIVVVNGQDQREGFSTNKSGTEQNPSGTAKTHSLRGDLYMSGYQMPEKTEPAEMAYRFFELNRESYHMTNPREDLVLEHQERDEYGAFVSFTQSYQGVPILRSTITAYYNNRGYLREVVGNYIYDLSLSTAPQIDSFTVWDIALKDLGSPEGAKVVNREHRPHFLVQDSLIYAQVGLPHRNYAADAERFATRLLIWYSELDRKYHLVWALWVDQQQPQHFWGFYIDAHDGTVLQRGDSFDNSSSVGK